MCETRDLGIKCPHWHTTEASTRDMFAQKMLRNASAAGQYSLLEEVGSKA